MTTGVSHSSNSSQSHNSSRWQTKLVQFLVPALFLGRKLASFAIGLTTHFLHAATSNGLCHSCIKYWPLFDFFGGTFGRRFVIHWRFTNDMLQTRYTATSVTIIWLLYSWFGIYLVTLLFPSGSLARWAWNGYQPGLGSVHSYRLNKLFQDYWRACFEINFSDRQEGLTVSSIICDR